MFASSSERSVPGIEFPPPITAQACPVAEITLRSNPVVGTAAGGPAPTRTSPRFVKGSQPDSTA